MGVVVGAPGHAVFHNEDFGYLFEHESYVSERGGLVFVVGVDADDGDLVHLCFVLLFLF